MECNVGGVDRVVRVLVGIVLTASAVLFVQIQALRISFGVIALLAFASSWFGFCFINKWFGINTARVKVPVRER